VASRQRDRGEHARPPSAGRQAAGSHESGAPGRRRTTRPEGLMPTYRAPVDEALFLLNDVFRMERYNNLPGFADASPDIVEAILIEGARSSEAERQPLKRVGDMQGCRRHDDGSVTTPDGFKEAYQRLIEGGWIGISAPAEYGGQGLPGVLTTILNEFFASANM